MRIPTCALVSALSVSILMSMPVRAGENTGPRSIVDMGCDNSDSICYVDISGPAAGSLVGCSSNHILWDSVNDPNGKNTYAAMLTAFAAGKQINIYIGACFATQQSFPTITYFNVYD